MKTIHQLLIAVFSVFCFYTSDAQVNTEGMVTFQVTTVSDGGTYAPRHVLAIWIKDGAGNFVKSRKVMAGVRKQHLVKWVASSNNNSTDAITGATLNQHTSHTISWDCRNLQGEVVPDGAYEVWIEYTSRNSASNGIAGPFFSFAFNKGSTPLNITIPDQTYFKNMSLTYSASAVNIQDVEAAGGIPVRFFNEANKSRLSFTLAHSSPVHLAVYDLQGRRVLELCEKQLEAGEHIYDIDHSQLPEGIMIVRLWTPEGVAGRKFQVTAR
ncbi:MAG: DUF2271 domain-containing protein [Bacteroidetes bacterium]|nr:DUF2271 domain-containing protein [Bacteroidota bacterium]